VAHFLVLGVAALDIINETDGFPREDSETRALAQRRAPGGNAANTANVLSQLGHRCSLAASLGPDSEGQDLAASLERDGIELTHAYRAPEGRTPCSYITVNRRNGSRTIVHYRDLIEYPFETFETLDLTVFDWIHFEGRDVSVIRPMLERARERVVDQPISLEVEKPREGIEAMVDLCDVAIFSGHYARGQGFEQPMRFLESLRARHHRPILICTWGEDGAVALDTKGSHFASPAYPPREIVDTVGAGDTFNAGLLDAMSAGGDLASALERACRLAGRKCGRPGLTGLAGS
jgi:ketohexokinase